MRGTFQEQARLLHRLDLDHSFQLIYCDPPFYSGKIQRAELGEFNDRWPTLADYLNFIQDYMIHIIPFLSPSGFFVLHCDPHASHYLKVLGDKIFGYENFRNEIIWHYTGRRTPAVQRVNSKHDVLLIWARSERGRMTGLTDPWTRDYYVLMKRQAVNLDDEGREWIWGHRGKGQSHAYRLYIDEAVKQGRPIDSVWEIPIINTSARERTGYPTQKPIALLRRVVNLLTEEGDWVADLMAGSGTAGEAALCLGRPVFLGDSNPDAVSIIQRRIQKLMH
jgi:site-specific DNA-methyltransferase (adenine-specific)